MEIEIFGMRHDMKAISANMHCQCQRPNECPDLMLGDMLHACWDVANAHGNAHRDRASGVWWVEWHYEFCWDIENHFASDARPQWHELGLSVEDYKRYILSLSPQDLANGNRRTHAKRSHQFIALTANEMAFTRPGAITQIAAEFGITIEGAKRKVVDLLSVLIASRIAARSVLAINHELTERYHGEQLLRLWSGAEQALFTLGKNRETLTVVECGATREIELGSLPAILEFKFSKSKNLGGSDERKQLA